MDKSIGLDLGIKSYFVTSSGVEVENPKHYRQALRKLRKANKKLSRTAKGSSNRVKAKTKLARAYERITNIRDDRSQQLLSAVARQFCLRAVSPFFPSSQTCNSCSFINPEVKDLKIREWICPECNHCNQRDKNAALNILSEGLRLLTAVGSPGVIKNACGESVRLGDIQAGIDEAGITRLEVV